MRCLTLLSLAACAAPADGTFEVHELDATDYKQTYTLNVFLPDTYTDAEPATVVYLFDGDQWTDTAAQIATALEREGTIDAPIVVGIGYGDRPNKRNRDYTPHGKGIPDGFGEIDAFYGFMEHDLVPWVDEGWSTDATPAGRVVMGHSFGGEAAVWGLFHAPETFGNAIGLSSSLVFADAVIFDDEAAFALENDDLDARFYLGAGSQEGYGLAGLTEAFGETLASREYPSLDLKTDIIRGRFHASLFPAGAEAGLAHVLEEK